MSNLPKELGKLYPEEQLILQLRPTPRAMIPYFFVTMILASSIIFMPLAILMELALILLYFVSYRTLWYFITTQRVILIRKVLSVDRQDIYYRSVRDFVVEQGLGGRVFRFGSIQPLTNNLQTGAGDLADSLSALRALSHISHPNEVLLTILNDTDIEPLSTIRNRRAGCLEMNTRLNLS